MAKKKCPIRSSYIKHAISDFVDYDYLDKLSDEELAWLVEFTDGHYKGDFTREKHLKVPDKKKREAYRANNARVRDVYNKFRRVHPTKEDYINGEHPYDALLDRVSPPNEIVTPSDFDSLEVLKYVEAIEEQDEKKGSKDD